MDFSFTAFIVALGTVVLAEMGDKTQLLAMAFASRYKASKVLIGVLIATVLNHALAVAAGSLISTIGVNQAWIQGAASLSFIFFGLWTVRGDKLEGEDKKKSRFGPVLAVAVAFFIAEMGDKTQLATVALAAKYGGSPVWVLAGTTLGMLIADGIGIIAGALLSKRVGAHMIKYISAAAFIVFGLIGTAQAMLSLGVAAGITAAAVTALALVSALAGYVIAKRGE